MRGRKPKPTALKVLAGNPGQRPLPENEPKPALGDWTPPEWMDGEALTEWERVVPIMRNCGMLAATDYQTVMAYCLTVEEIIDTKKRGEPLKTSLLGQLRSLASELGCTPSSRTRVQATKPKQDDDDAFFAVG